MQQSQTLSAKTVWGKIVLFLKEHHEVALHVACGDITDVVIENSNLVVNIKDSMLYHLLSDGRREIENALRWQGLDLGLKIEYCPTPKTPQEEDIDKLKKIFGEELIIK